MAIVGNDFRGLRLCEPCWNGVHWKRDKEINKLVNMCESSWCQCPCKEMQANRSGINRALRERAAQNKASQTAFPETGAAYEHVNPADRRQRGS